MTNTGTQNVQSQIPICNLPGQINVTIPSQYPYLSTNGESTCAFNEDLARQTFGNDFIDELKQAYNNRPDKRGEFRGDWFQLALLLRCHKHNPFRSDCLETKYDVMRLCSCTFCQHSWDWNGIHLENAYLPGIDLQYADLPAAHFENANLRGANLSHSHLAAVIFKGSFLMHSNLEESFLKEADFSNSDLQCSNFQNSMLYDSNFNKADIRDSYGIVFDESKIEKTHFDSEPTDPWSKLCREYSGTKFFIHLILLVVFFLPFIVKIPLLTFVSTVTNHITSSLDVVSPQMQPALLSLINYPIEKTLIAWAIFGFTITMILYNLLRGYLTYKVGLLRDAERRSNITPKRYEYYGNYKWFQKDIKKWWQILTYLLMQKEIYDHKEPSCLELQFREIKSLSLCKRLWFLWRNFPTILYAKHQFAFWLGWITMVGFTVRIGYWLYSTWVPVSLF